MLHIELLPKNKVIKTSESDPVNEYYLPFFGYFFRSKLEGVFEILKLKAGSNKFYSVCEIGYGSGILFPYLSRHALNLYGIEMHNKSKEIEETLRQEGVKAHLVKGDIANLPAKEKAFDVVVCLSLLEHLEPEMLDSVLLQMKRTIKNNGFLILGFPGENIVTKTLFTLFYGSSLKHVHISNYKIIKEAVRRNFILKKTIRFPLFSGDIFSLYFTCLCENKA